VSILINLTSANKFSRHLGYGILPADIHKFRTVIEISLSPTLPTTIIHAGVVLELIYQPMEFCWSTLGKSTRKPLNFDVPKNFHHLNPDTKFWLLVKPLVPTPFTDKESLSVFLLHNFIYALTRWELQTWGAESLAVTLQSPVTCMTVQHCWLLSRNYYLTHLFSAHYV